MKIEYLFNHNKRCNLTRAINTFQHTKIILTLELDLNLWRNKIYLL